MNIVLATVNFLACVSAASNIKTRSGYADFLASRIKRNSATCDNMLTFVQEMIRSMGCELDKMPQNYFALAFEAAQSRDADKLLAWIRSSPESVAMLATIKKEDREGICESIVLPEIPGNSFVAVPRRTFDIPLTIVCESNLSHGGEGNTGNSMLFRRQTVAPGLALPIYAGNALRGQIRDILAQHLVDTIGKEYLLETWFFHTIFSGGALVEAGKSKGIEAKLGSKGTTKGDGIREFRNTLPMLSLLGCAVGARILSGRICVGDFRPRCREWGTGEASAQSLFVWEFLTRRDDNESRESDEEHQGMIANTECLKVGTMLDGGIDISKHASEIEISALAFALDKLQYAYIGGGNRRGFGRIRVERSDTLDASLYVQNINDNRNEIISYLGDIGAITKKDVASCTL